MTDETTGTTKRSHRRFLLGVAGATALGLVALLVGVAQYGYSSNNSNNAASPLRQRRNLAAVTKIARMGPILETFKAGLPQYTLRALEDKTSPQSQAYDWLANHPGLPTLQEWRKQQLFALATIYFSMDGPNWIRDQNWGLGHTALWLAYGHPECQWYSVWNPQQACNAAGQMVSLDLEYLKTPSREIAMPPEIGLLTNLVRVSYHVDMEITMDDLLPVQTFDLPRLEQISLLSWGGSLPQEIGRMGGQLKSLSLYHNYLYSGHKGPYTYSGAVIPTELGLCTNLMDLAFHNIEFGGVLPTHLGALIGLNRLSIRGTNVNGQLPKELGRLSGLIDLAIADNGNLGGSLPPQLGSLTRLSQVSITNNPNLGGKIPSEFLVGGLNNVRVLDLSHNNFNDALPTEIGLATKLRTIDLRGNQLVGQLPSQLSRLTKLYRLYLQSNKLNGGLPSQMGLLRMSLRDFNASHNLMTRVLPTELGLLDSISSFDLSHNQLGGDLPMEILTMGTPSTGGGRGASKGWEIDLSHNNLGGELSGSVIQSGGLNRLLKLRLNHNQLRGEIPTQFGFLSKMDVLDLSSNNFVSTLPTQLGSMEELTHLDVSNLPQLRGPIPSQMARLTNLIDLDLSNCPSLTGSIPTEFTNLVYSGDLHHMDVTGNNRLAGIIPEGLCQLNTNQTYCYYRESCTFDYACGDLCGCEDVGCFCNNVNIDRSGGPF